MTLDFRSEAHTFYLDEKPFIPLIKDQSLSFAKEEGFHAAVVRLPAHPSYDLDWNVPIQQAKDMIQKGALIVWEFDFGLGKEKIALSDPAVFLSYTLAIEQFSSLIWPEFSHATLGAIFYRGDTDFLSRFVWLKEQEKNFVLWLENFYPEASIDLDFYLNDEKNKQVLQIYCLFVLSEYLHRLLSFLPDTLQVFCLFDVSLETSLAHIAQLFSKERFSHFHLGLRGSPIPITGICYEEGECYSGFLGNSHSGFTKKEAHFAVCLPSDEKLFSQGKDDLETILFLLNDRGISYRIIPESLLTQEWTELEGVICLTRTLTSFGRRSLQGFCAAGGYVVYYGKEGGFLEETSFEEFLKKESE